LAVAVAIVVVAPAADVAAADDIAILA